jgi:hypothetical protein
MEILVSPFSRSCVGAWWNIIVLYTGTGLSVSRKPIGLGLMVFMIRPFALDAVIEFGERGTMQVQQGGFYL